LRMVYAAPLIAISIGLIEVLRKIGLYCEEWCINNGKSFPLVLHWYTWYYLLCFALSVMAMDDMVHQIMDVTDWLEPIATERYANLTLNKEHHLYAMWKAEASLEGYDWLRYLSFSTPFWLIGTFAVSVIHTYLHVKKLSDNGGLGNSKFRDKTLRILGLPMCYGLMSFKSVIRMWQVCVDHVGTLSTKHFVSYEARKEFVLQMYEANFMVGDIYEAYALAIFGGLVMEVLVKEISKNAPIQQSQDDNIQKMKQSMGSLTVAGIMLFFWVCLLQATYTLVVTSLGLYNILPEYFSSDPHYHSVFQNEHTREKVHYFFYGGGFVASFAAIGNIILVESNFHEALHDFKPAPKFWGTKILVTIAFMQSIVLMVVPPMSYLSEVRRNLLYSTCLTIECFVIALMHLSAWNSDESWYVQNEPAATPRVEHHTTVALHPDLHMQRISSLGPLSGNWSAESPSANGESPKQGAHSRATDTSLPGVGDEGIAMKSPLYRESPSGAAEALMPGDLRRSVGY